MLILAALLSPALATQPTTGVLYGDVQAKEAADFGEHLDGAEVVVTGPDGRARTHRSDASGRYLFVDLDPGDYTLSVSHPPYDREEARALTVKAGEYTRRDADLTLTGLTVCVTDTQGAAIGYSTLSLVGPGLEDALTESTDYSGCVEWLGLTPGDYTVQVEPGDLNLYLPTTLTGLAVERGAIAEHTAELSPAPPPDSGLEYGVAGGVAGGVMGGMLGGSMGYGGGVGRSGVEGYTHYGTNGWTDTGEDALSTFGADVDTGSYTLARRKLRSWQKPSAAGVRVEEFVNYFDYSYVAPTGEADGDPAPFAVHMAATPHPADRERHILRIGVQGRQQTVEEIAAPMHLTVLVDNSGSMRSADKLELVKWSLRHLVQTLKPDDTVALATYAGSVHRVLDPTPVRDAEAIISALDELTAGGSTAMSSGIDLAYEMADDAYVDGHVNRVIVLSDGDANVGPSSHEAILENIGQYAGRGITLSTIGFGVGNYQDNLMEQLANQGDGNYFYIDSEQEAARVFGRDAAGTLEVIARDVKIQVGFDEDRVEQYRLLGYENRFIADDDFREDAVDGGEIGAGHQVTAIYEVRLTDGRSRRDDLATVRLRAKPPGPDAPAVEWVTTFPARLITWEFPDASPDLRTAIVAAALAEQLRDSPHTVAVDYAELWGILDGFEREDPVLEGQRVELLEMVIRADMLKTSRF